MKQELKTAYYLPLNGETELGVCYFSNFEEWKSKGSVKEQKLVTFTPEEYNKHIQDIIKDSLKTASEKAEVEVLNGYMEEPDEQEYVEQIFSEGNYRVKPYKESITNTFEETFNKYKL